MDEWRATILAIRDPLAQRYSFCRYVLGEPRLDSAAIAGAFQHSGRMDEGEYDVIVAGWASSAGRHPMADAALASFPDRLAGV